jgi:hypothetical protein
MKKHLILLIAGMLVLTSAWGQSPTLTTSSSTYSSLNAGTQIYKDSVWDDMDWEAAETSTKFALGFGFKWKGVTFDSVQIKDGLVNLTKNGEVNSLLFGSFSDLIDRGTRDTGAQVAQSPIYIKRTGVSPNAIFSIEWRNAGFFDELDVNGTLNDSMTMSIVIYQDKSIMEVHIGTNSVSGLSPNYMTFMTFGAVETNSGGDQMYLLDGEPNAPTLTTDQNTFGLTAMPTNGQKYSFMFSQVAGNINLDANSQSLFFTGNTIGSQIIKDANIQIFNLTGQLIETGKLNNFTYKPIVASHGTFIAIVSQYGKAPMSIKISL